MIIGFDVSMLVYPGSGVATYTFNLVKNLLKYDKKNQYKLFYSSLRRPKNFYYLEELREYGAKVYEYAFPVSLLKLWWNKLHVMPMEIFIGKVDIFHSSDFLRPPFISRVLPFTTLFDLTWKIYPHFHTEDIVNAHAHKLKKTVKFGDRILTISDKTSKDLIKYYPTLKDKIYVIPFSADERFNRRQSKKQIDNVLQRYNIQPPFILYVGAIEPRKNIDILIKAFNIIKDKFNGLSLVIAGRAGWKNEKIYQLVEKLKLSSRINFTGFIEDEYLPAVYQAAKVFVYPSSYEGFGLPPVEATMSGIPTISYNSPSMDDLNHSKIFDHKLAQQISDLMFKPITKKATFPSWLDISDRVLNIFEVFNKKKSIFYP